jgi:hypothetical protein
MLRATTDTGGVSVRTSDTALHIMHGYGGNMWGEVLYVMIYNRALSDTEVSAIYTNPYSPPTDGLILWLKMDEGTGTVVYDSSGQGNNGTIYGAKWVSSVGSAPATINVNITASQVTFNINIQTQAVDLKIYTPSGRWVVGSDLLPNYTNRQSAALPAATETTLVSVTGRGRLRTFGFTVYDAGTAFDIANNIKIRVYVDGSLRFEISLIGVDSLSGYPVDYLRQAMQYAIGAGIALPFNTAKFATSPDRYIIMPPKVSPHGGLALAIWDQTNSKYRVMAGHINLGMEYTSSLKIAVYNADASYSAYIVASYDIGAYL